MLVSSRDQKAGKHGEDGTSVSWRGGRRGRFDGVREWPRLGRRTEACHGPARLQLQRPSISLSSRHRQGILQGRGSRRQRPRRAWFTSSMQLVANKEDTFAIVDPPSLMLAIAQGMPLRMVAQIYQRSPNAVISWDEANVRPRRISSARRFQLYRATHDNDALRLACQEPYRSQRGKDLFAADGGTRNQVFLSKRAEAITGISNNSYLGFKGANPNIRYFLYSDYGINTMGDGVAANVNY